MTLNKVCPGCSAPSPTTWCSACKPPRPNPSRPYRSVGYDAAWDRLSKRARRLQPWCSDCGTSTDLTCDHSPEAWERKERGLPIRLQDVDVVCRACNSRRGPARQLDVDLEAQGGTPARRRAGAAGSGEIPHSLRPVVDGRGL